MSVPLVILGFLQERDYHGYELKKEIQRRMGNWTDIKFGSIYHALKQLVESGCVEVVGEEHHSGRPDRTIYKITSAGRTEFMTLLRELLGRFQRVYLEFDVGLYFASHLSGEELKEVLSQHQEEARVLKNLLGEVKQLPAHKKLPRISEVIVDHGIFHLEAEDEWVKMCTRRLRQEDLFSLPVSGSNSSRKKAP